MTNTEVVALIASTASDFFVFMLPVIAFMTGLVFVTSFLLYLTIGLGRRVFTNL